MVGTTGSGPKGLEPCCTRTTDLESGKTFMDGGCFLEPMFNYGESSFLAVAWQYFVHTEQSQKKSNVK